MRAAVCLLILALGGACTSDREPETSKDVGVAEANWFGASPGQEVLMTVRMSNQRDTPVNVSAIDFVADDGLSVRYLGYTTCRSGCIGMGEADYKDTQRVADDSIEGQFPLVLPPSSSDVSSVSLVVSLTVESYADARPPGCRVLREVVLSADEGDIRAGFVGGGEYVAALSEPEATNADKGCFALD